jgi:GT2 family glycosyltransferase
MTIHVTVVVPTYKRPELLKRCLAALLAQDFDPAAYEIIVADDAASGETQRLVEQHAICAPATEYEDEIELASVATLRGEPVRMFGTPSSVTAQPSILSAERRPPVRYLPVTGAHGPAAARNVGWHAARGALVAFTDDDCVPDPGWVGALAAALDNDLAGVSGRIIVPLPGRPTDYERDAAGLMGGEFTTANCCYRRDVLAAVGGFDEQFTAAWREDSDLQFTLLERGYQLCQAPDAVVIHPVRPAAWGVSLHQQRKSIFNALLYKKHPHLYRRRIQPAPPWHYYGIVGTLLGALAGIALRRRWLAMACILVWMLLAASARGVSRVQRIRRVIWPRCSLHRR